MTKLYGAALAAAKSKYNRVLVEKKSAVDAALSEFRQEHYRLLSESAREETCPERAAILLALAEHAIGAEPIYSRFSSHSRTPDEVWSCELRREPSLEGIANNLFGAETPRPGCGSLVRAVNECESWEKNQQMLA